MQILMPCAGAGSRFKAAGYAQPKPLIDVLGQPMYKLSGSTFHGDFIYLVPAPVAGRFEEDSVIPVQRLTEGAACTALLAYDRLNLNDELLIINADQLVIYNELNFNVLRNQPSVDGIVFTFKSQDTKWSYVDVNSAGRIVRAAEKKVISSYATVGAYYWKKARHFTSAAKQMIAANDRTNNEFYICPVLNYCPYLNIVPFMVDKMIGLGTPEDLEAYKNAVCKSQG